MRKAVTTITAAAALALFASGAFADCSSNHNVTASKDSQQTIAMSTYDGPVLQPTVKAPKDEAKAAVPKVCAEGEKDCQAATK
jgi:ABC-type sugar transport system substrate-binding protein